VVYKRLTALAIVAAMMVIIVVAIAPSATRGADSEEVALLNQINQYRAQQGLGKLVLSTKLTQAAYSHSSDMASKNYFAHDSLNGASFADRIKATGYSGNTYLGENIAAGISTGAQTFSMWKNSPGHNAIMLGKDYKAVGISRAYNANSTYKWYWTADFGGIADTPVTTNNPTTTTSVKPTTTTTSTKPTTSTTAVCPTTSTTLEKSTTPPSPPGVGTQCWANSYMRWLVKCKVMTGYKDGSLRPSKAITRAEFVVLVAKAFKIPSKGSKSFKDAKKHWAQGYIAALADRGYVSGYDNGKFKPNGNITRAEMVKILDKAAGLKMKTGAAGFRDTGGHWAKSYILVASSNGVINGYMNGKFRPNTTCSRADVSACLYRLLNK
jgi:hypothetical protein